MEMNQENVDHILDSLLIEGVESKFFVELLAEVTGKCQSLGITNKLRITDNFERLWLPLALNLAQGSNALDRTLIQGILGGQGTGKSTLCIVLKLILTYLGFAVAALSIDDLYLTYEARKALQQQDPRLIWRGPPGTHDVKLGLELIELCLQNNHRDHTVNISLPRFDKSLHNGAGDRLNPEVILQPDILLFEGWFVGVRSIDESFLANPPAPIITPEDQQFAVDCNRRLQSYEPLWTKLDSLIVLYPEDYCLSQQWRQEAEHKMIATGKTGMSDHEIACFVEYFWKALHPKLFIEPLTKTADLVVEIKSDHSLGKIHKNIQHTNFKFMSTKLPPLNTDTIWAILHEEIDDATVNQLVWFYLGYRYDETNQTWDSSEVVDDWREKYPEPPDFIANRPPTVKLTRSIPKENKQLLKEKLGFKGYKLGEFGPRQTRRATAANWLLNYMATH